MVRRCLPALLLLGALAHGQDVTILLLDDVGRADLDQLMSDGRAPNLRHLAETGFQFRNAQANPLCQPTRRCIDFGSFHVGVAGRVCSDVADPLAPQVADVSLAELVGVPSLFLGKWHEGANPLGGPWELTPQGHGWGAWRAGVAGGIDACGGSDYFAWTLVEDGVSTFVINTYQPAVQFDRWRTWKRQPARGPRLVMYSTPLAHRPFHRPPAAWLPPGYPPTRDDRARFEAMIAACDIVVGKMLADMGPRDVLIVTGDNGTPGELIGSQRAKGTTFERGINVPLILAGDWIRPGTSDALVHVVDLYATVGELLGDPGPAASDSRSLVPLMLGGARPVHRYVLCGTVGNDNFPDDVCVRSLRYKLRRVLPGSPDEHEEFYDLQQDPAELMDLSTDPAHARLVGEHRAWLDAVLAR